MCFLFPSGHLAPSATWRWQWTFTPKTWIWDSTGQLEGKRNICAMHRIKFWWINPWESRTMPNSDSMFLLLFSKLVGWKYTYLVCVCVCVAHMNIKRSNKGQLVEVGALLPTVVLKSGPTTGQQLLLPAEQSHQSFRSLTNWFRVWVPSSIPWNLFPGGLPVCDTFVLCLLALRFFCCTIVSSLSPKSVISVWS